MKKLILICLTLCLTAAVNYQSRTVSQSWKLNSAEILDQLDPISGRWDIVTPDKLKEPVLSQFVKYADFPKVLFRDHEFYDFDATVKLYISSENQETQSAGMVLRYRNLYSFYMLFVNTKDKRITLTRASLGGLKVVKRLNFDFQPDHWYNLKAHCYLNNIKAFVDDQQMLDAEDSTSTGGKIGLVSAGTTKAYFSDLQINTETIEGQSPQTAPQTAPAP